MRSDPRPAPTEANLYEAALTYLARYASSEASLRAVLRRRIERWARTAAAPDAVEAQVAQALRQADAVVARLAAAGAVDDTAFAESRTRSLIRAGRSRRDIAARLAAKGVKATITQHALPQDAESEFGAALVLARKRRIGPFRTGEPDQRRELAIMARAGFPRSVAAQALATTPDEAEAAIRRLRDG